jgi:hypothetical protein
MVIKQSEWPAYQAQGASLGACPTPEVPLNPSRPRPTIVDNDITVCALVGRFPTTMVIKQSEWPAYQAQGASLGACQVPPAPPVPPIAPDSTIVICVTENGIRTTRTINIAEWPAYLKLGATEGACSNTRGGSKQIEQTPGGGEIKRRGE